MKPAVSKNDYRVWKYNRCGAYSVKSGYWLINKKNKENGIQETEMKPSTNELKNEIWSLHTSPKLKAFLWKMLSEALPLVDLIAKRGMTIDSRCQICGLEGESINNVLFSCTLARQVGICPISLILKVVLMTMPYSLTSRTR